MTANSAPRLVVGLGCRRECTEADLRGHLAAVLAGRGWSERDIMALATLDSRAELPAVVALAARLCVSVSAFTADVLDRQDVPTPGARVRAAVGTRSVAEAAVLASGARLVVPKHASARSTIAIGLMDVPDRPDHEGAPHESATVPEEDQP